MKILLVQSYLGGSLKQVFPIGLSYLARSLKKHTVKVLDLNLHSDPMRVLAATLSDYKPDVVGFSLRNVDSVIRLNLVDFMGDFEQTVRLTKETLSRAIVVVGGAGFSVFAAEVMARNRGIDFGFYQEAEESLPELLDDIEHPEKVKGVFFWENGELQFTGPRQRPNFRSLPWPDRGPFELEKYRPQLEDSADPMDGFKIGVQTKRGCALNCTYCNYPSLSGHSERLRNPGDVVDELAELAAKWSINNVFFVDTVINHPRRHAEELCRELIKRKLSLRWGAYFDIRFCDEDFLLLCQRAGCEWFEFSPDGYSNEALKGLRKGIRSSDIVKTVELFRTNPELKKAHVYFYFFVSPPGETLAGLIKTIFFVKRTMMHLHGRGGAYLNWIKVLPNTPMLDIALADGTIGKGENLLHSGPEDVKRLFYSQPSLRKWDFALRRVVSLLGIGG
jgi:anaerobic magnesium-protoporphyrin IX monomethyl ester cyclase